MTFFCNRGRENVRNFKVSDFTIFTDEDGLRYLTKRDQLTKNHRENDDEATGGFMYEIPSSDRCPVKSFEIYVSKLQLSCEWFWQKPKASQPRDGNELWYCNSPVGINTLSNKMKTISTNPYRRTQTCASFVYYYPSPILYAECLARRQKVPLLQVFGMTRPGFELRTNDLPFIRRAL